MNDNVKRDNRKAFGTSRRSCAASKSDFYGEPSDLSLNIGGEAEIAAAPKRLGGDFGLRRNGG